MSRVSFLHRNRFLDLPTASVLPIGPNVWQIRFSLPEALSKRVRKDSLDDWDGVVFCLDDVETQPAVAVSQQGSEIEVSVVVL